MIPGVLLLSYWIGRGSIGELANSPIRRNWVPYFVPFALMFVWHMLGSVLPSITGSLVQKDTASYDIALHLGRALVDIGMIVLMLFLAGNFFAGGVKGFGLDIRRCLQQFKWAVVNYIAIIPLVQLGVAIIALTGVKIEQHETLVMASQSDSMVLKVIIVIFVIAVIPIFEEMIFRGMFQSMIVGFINSKWAAIMLTSILFTAMHRSETHWLALFALSVSLGYAYEKSGSLWRSIFIHSIFNAVSISLTLLQ